VPVDAKTGKHVTRSITCHGIKGLYGEAVGRCPVFSSFRFGFVIFQQLRPIYYKRERLYSLVGEYNYPVVELKKKRRLRSRKGTAWDIEGKRI
jgi:hypothetical protein